MTDAATKPSTEKQWAGHPRALRLLFTTEMWERFGYYGMRALLILYLVQHFVFADRVANGLYGAFTSLVYLTPLIGGLIADQYFGSKKAVKFGAILMSVGYFLLAFSGGETAKAYVTIDDARYEVDVVKSGADVGQYLVDGENKHRISGNEDGSISLEGADGALPAIVPAERYKFDADRNPVSVILLFTSLGLIVIGNGYFKPNISTIVGTLYQQGDRRRDAGFTIFYMGINLGSIISQLFAPAVAAAFGWQWGFALAGFGMLLAWARFQFTGDLIKDYGNPPEGAKNRDGLIILLSILAVPVVWFLLNNAMEAATIVRQANETGGILAYLAAQPLLGKVMASVYTIAMIGIPLWAIFSCGKVERDKMIVAVILTAFSVVFWTLFEQAGSSLTLFADRNTDLAIGWTAPMFEMFRAQLWTYYAVAALLCFGLAWLAWWFFSNGEDAPTRTKIGIGFAIFGLLAVLGLHYARPGLISQTIYVMQAGQVQVFNPLFIVIFAPIFSAMWVWLSKRGLEPSVPLKFAIGLLLVGLGFLALVFGAQFHDQHFVVPLFWLALAYFIHSMGELFLSPVGLSMITKLSIPKLVGLMMGVWFLSSAMAQYVGGIVAQFASTETVGGEVLNAQVSLDTYLGVFQTIGFAGIASGVVLLVLWPILRKGMHGVN